MSELADKVITGATPGIGRAIIPHFSAPAAEVIAAASTPNEGTKQVSALTNKSVGAPSFVRAPYKCSITTTFPWTRYNWSNSNHSRIIA